MKNEFTIQTFLPTIPNEIYDAWLNGEKHAKMTGGAASGTAEIGANFTAWDGYIEGRNLELEAGKRIVQSWRTSEFAPDDPDSRIELKLEPQEGGTKLTLIHTNIPDGQPDYEQGWHDHYFNPMREYFSS